MRIDRRTVGPRYVFRVGLLGGLIGELLNIIGRLAVDALSSVGALLHGSHISPVNFLFALTDQLPAILAMGIFALALPAASAARSGRTFLPRFLAIAVTAAVTSVAIQSFLYPAFLDLIGLHYRWPEPVGLWTNAISNCVLGTLAGLGGLVGLRIALRIAFDDRAFPDWPVPSPNSVEL